MTKIFIALLVVVVAGFIALSQGFKNVPTENKTLLDVSETDTEISEIDASGVNTNNADAEPAVSSGVVLDLSNQGLTQVPGSVFDRRDIQTLNLSDNRLTGALPAEVRNLQNLRVLDLSNNEFTGVPAEIGQLKNLEVLNLSHNNITGLPLELGNLPSLKVLNLRGNQYSTYDLELIKEKLPASVVIEVD